MRIKILNKNNNNLFDVDDGAVFTECYNETLDTGTITISNLSTPIDIEPYDIIAIYKTDSISIWKYMCVDTYTETMLSINPKLYRYEISLFSETKQLEGTILPNLKITKVWNINRTLYHYINQYMNEYCPKIRVDGDVEDTSLDTVINIQITIEDGVYYYTVTLQSSSEVLVAPDTSKLKVSSTAIVTLTPGSIGQQVTDDNCRILSNNIVSNHWVLQYKMTLGEYNVPPGVSLDSYKVYEHLYNFIPKFTWDTLKNRNKFNYTNCPEMQWNTPTLREVLNDLMMVVDCIPVIKNGELDFLDLTDVTVPTDETLAGINYVTKSRSSEDYVSELQVKLENVTNKVDGVNNLVTKVEYCHLNAPDNEATLTTNNIVLRTQYPIYRLKSVIIMFPARGVISDSNYEVKKWMGADLMNLEDFDTGDRFSLISEYQEWITKPIRYNSVAPGVFKDWANYQNFSLYYTRANTDINNLGNTGKWTVIFSISWVLWQLLVSRIMDYFSPIQTYDYVAEPNWYNLFFKVEYETLEGCLFRASKGDCPEHERVVIDNQTNSMIDSYSQGFLEYQKANRLGNEQLQINARYLPSETVLEISNKYENSIIYQCQYQFFRDHTEVNAQATKDYVLREYFTGVKSKIRSWAIASGSEALTRHDLFKYYCEFSYSRYNEANGLNTLLDNNIASYFTTPIGVYTAQPLKCSFVRTIDRNNNSHPKYYSYTYNVKSYYCLDLMSRLVGNSLIFTFSFPDNYWAGQSIHTESDYVYGETAPDDDKYIKLSDIEYSNSAYSIKSSALSGGGVPMYQHTYTDNNGEFVEGEIIFGYGNQILAGYSTDLEIGDDLQPSGNRDKDAIYNMYQRPRVSQYAIKYEDDYNYEQFRVNFNLHKDSQEIINISTQFEFCSDTNDICFSREFLRKQQAISVDNNNPVFTLRVYDKSLYNFRKPEELPSGAYTDYLLYISRSTSYNRIANIELRIPSLGNSVSDTALNNIKNALNNKCGYMLDSSNNVIMAFNDIPTNNIGTIAPAQIGDNYIPYFIFYMNVLRNRNKNIYDSINHYIIDRKL